MLEAELTRAEGTGMGCRLIHFLSMLVSDSEVGGLAGSTLVVSIHDDLWVQ